MRTSCSLVSHRLWILASVTFLAIPILAAAQAPDVASATPSPTIVLPEPYLCPPTPCAEAEPAEAPPPPFGGPICERTKLTGDWFGARETLRDRGITWDISATNFYQGVTTGGLQQAFRYGGRADYLLAVDGHKAGLWQGLFINLHGETLFGRSVNSFTGALLPISIGQSVPLPDREVTALTGVKITQALSENFLVYFGKINTADDFNQPFTGGPMGVNGFMNMGLAFPPILARTIPYSAFGGGFAVLREKEVVFAVGAFDTNSTPTVSGFDTFFDDGVAVNAVASLPTKVGGRPGHYTIGGVYSSGRYGALDDLRYLIVQRLRGELPAFPQKKGSWAVYSLFDQAIWVDACDPKRSWGVFGHAGITDGNPNPIRWSANVGVGGSSMIPGRGLDTFGAGYFYVGLSESFKNFAPRLVPLSDEHGVEVFYNIAVTPWFHFTPDLQVVSPARSRVDTSLNVGVRAKIDF